MCLFFFFVFQGAQTVGMGAEAVNVPAAAKLFDKANDILGYVLIFYSTYTFSLLYSTCSMMLISLRTIFQR
jgi:malonyl CoA-acyl carrier protein transacylase